ncbi:LPO_1073/Vpar_1526 family protein [Micromonospora chersina]|uniref:LPO_1073/Vpar_1526 family protein n=1 Tax=Micromonospora chersina TaxID=47854 RepID=UPI0037170A58
MSDKQYQRAGDGSTLVQAGTVHVGLSYADARQIAEDVFAANFMKLKGEAHQLAQFRMEEITDRFLQTLLDRNPEAIENARKPGAQRALYRVQEEYACSGDTQIADMLVAMLVERFGERDRSFRQLVLDEAMATIPKLTMPQIASLSLIFFMRQVHHSNLPYASARTAIHTTLVSNLHAIGPIACSLIDLRHLEYSGCIALADGQCTSGHALTQNYPGAFSNGINPHSVPDEWAALMPPHPDFPDKRHIPVIDKEQLQEYLEKAKPELTSEEITRITAIFMGSPMSEEEVKEIATAGDARLRQLFDAWDETRLKNAEITSIGTAIGHANLQRANPDFTSELDPWLREHGSR